MTTTTRGEASSAGPLEARVAALESEVANLKNELEYVREQESIRRGLREVEEGKTTPAREAFDRLRKKYQIPVPPHP